MTDRRLLVAYTDGADGPLPDPGQLPTLVDSDISLLLGWTVRRPDWIDVTEIPISALMVGPGLRGAADAGLVRAVPTRLSAIPGLLAGRLRPDVVVVPGVERPDGWHLVGSPGWARHAVGLARMVIVENWTAGPSWSRVGPLLPPCQVAGVIDRTEPPDPAPEVRSTPAHATVGRLVAGLIPEGATLQWGPGAIGAAVVRQIDRPVGVWSGLVTDELADLDRRGFLAGTAVAAYAWGTDTLHHLVDTGRLDLREMTETHDLTKLSALERFVAVNTALQVGLDGAANVEVVGGRTISGPGGHPDFAAGASRSPGGLSIVALPATSAGRSSIVAVPEAVSTPRSDVDVVVTEHGVADLRGMPVRERADRIIAVAAPQFRDALRAGLSR